jgi:imidazole glycerol-phosphate synthase subunit HisH
VSAVVVIDYGLGNLRSVAGAVTKLGFDAVVSRDHADLERAGKLILPGVGAFGDGMRLLHERGLTPVLNRLVLEERKPVLGVCLGAELMARDSEEFGQHQGLGWIEASVKRIEGGAGVRVPHVGWNAVHQTAAHPMFDEVPQDALFYFVHSYHIVCDRADTVVGVTEDGALLTAAFARGNIWGTQFHPEKSQRHGLALLGNFLRA